MKSEFVLLVGILAITRLIPVQGRFNATSQVKFHLFTRQNVNESVELPLSADPDALLNSGYDPSMPTRILVHGWKTTGLSAILVVKDAYLRYHYVNVISVDWGEGASSDYLTAVQRIGEVGKVIKEFLNNLERESPTKLSSMIIIGHSLGAHIAGVAGHTLGGSESGSRLGAIVALDPAMPFIPQEINQFRRVAKEDARYVQMMKTSSLALLGEVGHGNFFPNYGVLQPSCGLNIVCAHGIAYEYFAETLSREVMAKQCSYSQILDMNCGDSGEVKKMGGEPLDETAEGSFYLKTAKVKQWMFDN